MFRGATNPYDDIVVKATDENQTSENWEIILNLCDKVTDEGEQGARNVIAALLKRLTHRNANVQLYSLAVAEALSKNCGIEVHRELASRAFTQGLEKLVTDRTGHDKVKKKALSMIQSWAQEWEKDPSLGIMNECYESLKSKNYKFEQAMEAPPPQVDEEIRRREEEELQKVLELSMQDKGGRQWGVYTPSSAAGGSSSSYPSSTAISGGPSSRPQAKPEPQQPTGGYTASAGRKAVDVVHQSPLRHADTQATPVETSQPTQPSQSAYSAYAPAAVATPPPQPAVTVAAPAASVTPAPVPDLATATRVRALHHFEPADAGELAFEKGDVIKVVDRTHKDWWKGQLKGRTGIFPVNYVEPMPEPTAADLAREAEAEAAVFAQAANIDKLLNRLKNFDITKDNLADDEDIQELYRSSLSVRPKVIRLIEKYNQKKVELAMMNDNFVNAKELFDRMMEESLAKHNPNAYDFRRHPSGRPGPPGVDYRATGYWPGPFPPPQPPGQPGFYPGQPPYQDPTQATYPPQLYPPQMDPAAYPPQQGFPGQDPNAYGPQQAPAGYDPSAYAAPIQQPQIQPGQPQQQPGYDPNTYQTATQQPGAPQPAPGGYDPNVYGQQPPQQPQPSGGQPVQQPYDPSANAYAQTQPGVQPIGQPSQPAYDLNAHVPNQQLPAAAAVTAQYAGQSTTAAQPQPTTMSPQPEQQVTQPVQQVQPTQPSQPETQPVAEGPKVFSGPPPYPFDPTAQYPDPNAQAWAQYYAAGGDDKQGLVYFISVPGMKEAPAGSPASENPQVRQQSIHTATFDQSSQPMNPANQQLSPKSPTGQLSASPKSKRISMAGVGTVSQHPQLQNTLPTYAQEHLHSKRPSSAGSQPGSSSQGTSGAPSWAQHPPAGVTGPWSAHGPQIMEPSRTDSTSPPGGYRPMYGATSPGGSFHPASAGPIDAHNQATPYPTHPSPRSQQQQQLYRGT